MIDERENNRFDRCCIGHVRFSYSCSAIFFSCERGPVIHYSQGGCTHRMESRIDFGVDFPNLPTFFPLVPNHFLLPSHESQRLFHAHFRSQGVPECSVVNYFTAAATLATSLPQASEEEDIGAIYDECTEGNQRKEEGGRGGRNHLHRPTVKKKHDAYIYSITYSI